MIIFSFVSRWVFLCIWGFFPFLTQSCALWHHWQPRWQGSIIWGVLTLLMLGWLFWAFLMRHKSPCYRGRFGLEVLYSQLALDRYWVNWGQNTGWFWFLTILLELFKLKFHTWVRICSKRVQEKLGYVIEQIQYIFWVKYLDSVLG